MHAIVSIHDVMPETLDRVDAIVTRLPPRCRHGLLLLVVPGKDWRTKHIAQLRAWQDQGMELAGHGWTHEVKDITGWYHTLHSLLISRRAAEHLSLTGEEIERLMAENYEWFIRHQLGGPQLYVPPAWALGDIAPTRLANSAFEYVEVTSGILHIGSGKTWRLPLAGFEADRQWRRIALTANNNLNRAFASADRPLRISIHPYDDDYLLAPQLWAYCAAVSHHHDYRARFSSLEHSH